MEGMVSVAPHPDEEGQETARVGHLHQVFKHTGDLFGPCKRFCEAVAEASGLLLDDLVHAVYRLELMMLDCEKRERHRLRGRSIDLRT